jgi:hypothetical protein
MGQKSYDVRMKNILMIVGLLLVSPLIAAEEVAEAQTFGSPLKEAQAVTIAQLLSKPDSFVGKAVRIEGKITDVCPMAGCWIDVQDQDAAPTIRFKVKDGEIVFPVEAKGKPVQAEGIFAKMELDAEQAERYRKHMAEELGEAYDPEAESGAMVVYRIDGVGATIR